MIRRVLTTSLAALCACLAIASAGAGAVVIGIGSSDPGMFSSPRFGALHITTVRIPLPWDVMTRRADAGELRGFRTWLSAAQARASGRSSRSEPTAVAPPATSRR